MRSYGGVTAISMRMFVIAPASRRRRGANPVPLNTGVFAVAETLKLVPVAPEMVSAGSERMKDGSRCHRRPLRKALESIIVAC